MEDSESEVDLDQAEPEAEDTASILDVLAALYPEAIPVKFVLVTEWMEADGSGGMTWHSTVMPPWVAKGLLQHALDEGLFWAAAGIVQEEPVDHDEYEDLDED